MVFIWQEHWCANAVSVFKNMFIVTKNFNFNKNNFQFHTKFRQRFFELELVLSASNTDRFYSRGNHHGLFWEKFTFWNFCQFHRKRKVSVLLCTNFIPIIFLRIIEVLLDQFVPNAPFLYPLRTSENCKAIWYFQGLEKGCIGNIC